MGCNFPDIFSIIASNSSGLARGTDSIWFSISEQNWRKCKRHKGEPNNRTLNYFLTLLLAGPRGKQVKVKPNQGLEK